jgi:hypothetical protein
MDDIQIYYAASENIIRNLTKQSIELDSVVRLGNKTTDELKTIITSSNKFCRDEKSITVKHLVNSLSSSVILYASRNEEVLGVLIFMFNENRSREKFINFDGICSPEAFGGLGVGHNLIETLIRIGRFNGVSYIKLECKSNMVKYYKNKFGFEVSEQKTIYDSDAESDDEGESYYYMTLRLSTVSGGKKRRKRKTKKNKKSKRKQTKKR